MSRRVRGLTLIELMIAMLIGVVLILGLVQVFAASRSAYMLSEGMSRVQENGRFGLDYLQRDIRMVGHFGCVNDQAHMANSPQGLVSLFGAHPGLDFFTSVQGYEADGTAPGAGLAISETPAVGGTAYSPTLPAEIAAATTNRINGSDIIALRFLAAEGVPVTAIEGTPDTPVFRFDPARWDVLRSGADNPGLFGVADCISSVVFQAAAVDSGNGSVTAGSTQSFNASSVFTRVFTEGQATLHRAESVVFYVGRNDQGQPSLYRVRFTAGPSGALVAQRQELVEGIENMQLLYGVDRQLDPTRPADGFIDRLMVASGVQAAATPAREAWRRVGAVQIGLLAVSPQRATAVQGDDTHRPSALGVTYTVPDDGRYRTVYESTIAMRNRLYGN